MNKVFRKIGPLVFFICCLMAGALIATPGTAEGSLSEPLIVIFDIVQSPAEIVSGETFTENFTLTNVGDAEARMVQLSLNISYPFAVVGSSSNFFVGDLNPGENRSVLAQIAVDKTAFLGVYSILYTISYKNSTGESYVQSGTFGVQVFGKPQLYVHETVVNQSLVEIAPGETFTENFNLANAGDSEARMVQLSLNMFDPFAVVGSSSNFFVGDLNPGENKSVMARIAVDENALVGVYSIPFTIQYTDSTGGSYVQSGTFGVQVFGKPQLYVDSITVDPSSIHPGESGLMTVKLTNVGTDVAVDASMKILGGNDIIGSSFAYIAKIDSKQSQSILFPVSVDGKLKPGTYLLNITVAYRDNSNNTYRLSKLYEFELRPVNPFIPSFYTVAAAVIIALVVAGYFVYTWKPEASRKEPRRKKLTQKGAKK